MLPLSQSGGKRPISVIDAPKGLSDEKQDVGVPSELTNESPCVSSLVDFHARCVDIGRVAEIWQPHIFDMKIIE